MGKYNGKAKSPALKGDIETIS